MVNIVTALACSFLWAGVTIGGKMLSGALPSFAFAFLRYGLSALCLLPFVLMRKEKETLKIRYLPVIMFLGFTLVLVFNALFFNAVYYSSATSVSLIMATNPILTMLISALLFRHIPNRYQLLAFMLSFAGAVLVITEGKMGFSILKGSIGEFLMLLGVLFQIMYTLALKQVSTHFSPLFLSFATMVSGILFVFPFVANKEFVDVVMNITLKHWGIIGFISFFGTALAIYLYSVVIKNMGPTRTSLIVFSALPVFVMILAFIILGESISLWQLLGGTLVLSSLVIGLRHTR